MFNIIKASLFKLFKDKTFRVTLIIGLILGIALPCFYKALNNTLIGNGSYMLVSSFNPTQNFGLAIPINLIILIVGEFTFGTIRNKVIVGYRKSYIYFSIFLVGLIFTLTLLLSYTGLSILMGSILNGGWGSLTGSEAGKFILIGICGYIFVTSLSVFFATLTRNQGSAIGLTILILVACMIGAIAQAASSAINNNPDGVLASCWLNPLFSESIIGIGNSYQSSFTALLSGKYLAGSICSPLIYATIFYVAGMLLFKNRDLK